eukprot:TRINITY_DN4856_c0_g1_i2.p1 TRINITY_DN4856_c0_g1~~TRINITY_DN4856_c0_g1_i2.p1  ORF type:complete len:314 (-),score=69.45 TRINITY_DN4856_c0_g1_i2:766-1599(-)
MGSVDNVAQSTSASFPLVSWMERRNKVHAEQMEKRRDLIDDIDNFDAKRAEWSKFPLPFYLHEPTWNCPFSERIGRLGDGGKWICGLRLLKDPCIIYSFGSEGETSFESEASYLSGCEIHIFDPTLRTPPKNLPPRTYFHKLGLSDKPGVETIADMKVEVDTLKGLMDTLGHDFIDVVKMDIEKAEWRVFKQLADSSFFPFDQLSIEIHDHHKEGFLDDIVYFFNRLDKAGFRIWYRENNPFWFEAMEYSLISKRGDDRLIKLAVEGGLSRPFLARY